MHKIIAITYTLALTTKVQSYPASVEIHGELCTINLLSEIITTGIDGYLTRCNCADMAHLLRLGYSCSQTLKKWTTMPYFASFFTLFSTLKLYYWFKKWLKQSHVTYNYCSNIGNTLNACAFQYYTLNPIYFMSDT